MNITRIRIGWIAVCIVALVAPLARADQYKNFRVAVYAPVGITNSLGDPERLQSEWDRISSQVKVDKVYLETYRSSQFADDQAVEAIKKFFQDKGVELAGGVTLATGGQGGQFGTFDYETPEHREECRRAIEQAARHFDEVVLDDFFFYTTKSDADIAAKGDRSWTQYRLDTMRDVARELVIDPAKAVNPDVKVVIKYPNWYEHFQGLGFDLEQQPKMFDGIYTGTETREAAITDQHLQPYLSYEIIRYFNNIAPGRNGGGWVDTFDVRHVDRYAEQLWDTMFAKAPEITLFNWGSLARQAPRPGDREAWADLDTSFDYDEMLESYKPAEGAPQEITWARVAGYSLEQVDQFLDKLGHPIGIASYKPYHSTGEDFLHNYLGMIGLPIELYPEFPTEADIVLLTEAAKFDPAIVEKIKQQLVAGRNVVITSGLLKALQGNGIEDIVELRYTDRTVAVRKFLGGYGAGAFQEIGEVPAERDPILIPEIRFLTNDAWQLVQAVAQDTGFPILLMNRYSNGIIYVLTIPENPGDLYSLPQATLTMLRRHLMSDFPVMTDSPSKVSLFAYDNKTFIIQSFRDEPSEVTIVLPEGTASLHNILTGADLAPQAEPEPQGRRRWRRGPGGANFNVQLLPHSYMVFSVPE